LEQNANWFVEETEQIPSRDEMIQDY